MSPSKTYLAVDLGASLVRVSVFDEQLKTLLERQDRTRDTFQGKADPNFRTTIALIESVLRDSGAKPTAGCMGVPEYVDANGRLTSKEQIDWHEQPKDILNKRFEFPWIIESDVRCAAIAETNRYRDFLYVTLSSGISHCQVINARPLQGENGRAIGLGTMKSSKFDATVEEIASGLGISRNYETVSGNSLSTSEIIARYGTDELASKLVNEAVSEFALALNHATMILDPARIIIGGGFWLGSDLFRKLTRARFDELMADNLKPEILDAHLKSGALIGAGELAYRLGNSKRS